MSKIASWWSKGRDRYPNRREQCRQVINSTWVSLKNNVPLTVASILCAGVALSLMGTSMAVSSGIENATARWRGGVETIIFLDPSASESVVTSVGKELRDNPLVSKVSFVSQQDAYGEFAEMFSDSPELVKSIGSEALPSSWRVVPVRDATTSEIESIGERWQGAPGVYQVVYAKDAVRAVLRISGTVSWSLSLLATVLGFAAWLLLLAGARAAAFSRREELSIMRMVGAGRMMVRLPFVLEGAIAGLTGAFGASLAVSRTSREIERRLSGEGDVAILQSFVITDSKINSVILLMAGLGVLLGASASFWAVGRYVRASEGLPTNMLARTLKRVRMFFGRIRAAKAQRAVSEAFAPLQSEEYVTGQQRPLGDHSRERGEDVGVLNLHQDGLEHDLISEVELDLADPRKA